MDYNNKIINKLKNITIYDFILSCISNNNLKEEENSIIYTAKELQEMYPKLFSKYKLDQAIKKDKLPYFKSGRERYFIKSEIDKWLKDKNRDWN